MTQPIQLIDQVFALEMPIEAESCEIRGEHPGRTYQLLSFYGEHQALALPAGNWEIICTSKECTEEHRKQIVERQENGWKDYNPDNFHQDLPFINSDDSLGSLLVARSLNPELNYIILKKTA